MSAKIQPAQVTAGHIRERLAGTRMPTDPLAVVMPPGSRAWPEDLRRKMCENLKPAGVLIPILEYPDGLSVLLTQRSADLKIHAGQVSFPGGRMEPADADITVTALRETHEEVGIRPEQVDIAGYLQPMLTVTGYAVTPIVGLIQPGISLTLDHSEVEHAFEVPLSFLLDDSNQRQSEREFLGVAVPIVEFNYATMRIWGATASMLVALRHTLL
ncbi:MAG: CoA pyrophosphatase [Woeseiaceae bacterium]|nr:CoA pyrophosphatase [Woeseiaceae bacterium]